MSATASRRSVPPLLRTPSTPWAVYDASNQVLRHLLLLVIAGRANTLTLKVSRQGHAAGDLCQNGPEGRLSVAASRSREILRGRMPQENVELINDSYRGDYVEG